jgi:hypothetical protein
LSIPISLLAEQVVPTLTMGDTIGQQAISQDVPFDEKARCGILANMNKSISAKIRSKIAGE